MRTEFNFPDHIELPNLKMYDPISISIGNETFKGIITLIRYPVHDFTEKGITYSLKADLFKEENNVEK